MVPAFSWKAARRGWCQHFPGKPEMVPAFSWKAGDGASIFLESQHFPGKPTNDDQDHLQSDGWLGNVTARTAVYR
jgi:hypothetical protein